MPDETLTIRRATGQDVTLLADLGARTFYEAFAHDNKPEDIERYIAGAFNPEQMALELADPGSTFIVAQLNGEAIGYAKLRAGSPPACVDGPRPIELERIYVAQNAHGRGVGAALMRTCLDTARQTDYGAVWLGVWERNARARAFYRKWGFHNVGVKTFTVGDDVQNDRVMMCVLEGR